MGKRRLSKSKKNGVTDATLSGTVLGAALAGLPGAIIGGLAGYFIADSVESESEKKKAKKKLRRRNHMANKVIFIAFAIEDQSQRDLLVGQSIHTETPFDFTDMSVKEPYDSGWKDKVRTRIRRSDGIIALISKNSLNSTGQKWEIDCAADEGKSILAIWAYSYDRTVLPGSKTATWTWDRIAKFIDSL